MTADHVRRWATGIDAAARRMTATFEAEHGYPPGVNEVRWAGGDAEMLGCASPMAGFYRVVAEVRLPDVANGFFIHRAADALELRDGIPGGLVIGSTGGGEQYVVDRDGGVHRSIGASLDGEFERVADSVDRFLVLLRHAITEFIENNRIIAV